jgi:hypothetical protein
MRATTPNSSPITRLKCCALTRACAGTPRPSSPAAGKVDIGRLKDFTEALRRRHDEFHALGRGLADHGLNRCHADFCAEKEAAMIFDRARAGRAEGPGGAFAFRIVHDAVLRAARRRERLDQSTASGRLSQREIRGGCGRLGRIRASA